ncbi:hypothetical protein [Aegicerativicinus sediminis]|uniref:hypothetical protein n=1 Tax=Aegicerativicinus sediminis TaxID=2893202 RepID=UPI001E2D641B|nr:hypothetical protein [Aegicerativicinus sediminis]
MPKEKPSRTKITQSDIPPKSASEIFGFIDRLLNKEKLSKKYFDENIYTFNPIERYYLCDTLKKYLTDQNRKNYLIDWLEFQYKVHMENDAHEDYEVFENTIVSNKNKLLHHIDYIFPSIASSALDLKRHEVPLYLRDEIFDGKAIDSRIPLLYKPDNFKRIFLNIWAEDLTTQEADTMFKNSFWKSSLDRRPITLNLHIDRKSKITRNMAITYKEYKSHISKQAEKTIIDYKKYLKTLPPVRTQFMSKYEWREIPREPFAYALYNAFPYYRDRLALKKLNDSQYNESTFFENMVKNFSTKRNA